MPCYSVPPEWSNSWIIHVVHPIFLYVASPQRSTRVVVMAELSMYYTLYLYVALLQRSTRVVVIAVLSMLAYTTPLALWKPAFVFKGWGSCTNIVMKIRFHTKSVARSVSLKTFCTWKYYGCSIYTVRKYLVNELLCIVVCIFNIQPYSSCGYSTLHCPVGIKLVGSQPPKPMDKFSPCFQDMFLTAMASYFTLS